MDVTEGRAAGHRRRFDSMSHAARFCRCIAAERADGRAGGHSSKGRKKTNVNLLHSEIFSESSLGFQVP